MNCHWTFRLRSVSSGIDGQFELRKILRMGILQADGCARPLMTTLEIKRKTVKEASPDYQSGHSFQFRYWPQAGSMIRLL